MNYEEPAFPYEEDLEEKVEELQAHVDILVDRFKEIIRVVDSVRDLFHTDEEDY